LRTHFFYLWLGRRLASYFAIEDTQANSFFINRKMNEDAAPYGHNNFSPGPLQGFPPLFCFFVCCFFFLRRPRVLGGGKGGLMEEEEEEHG